MPQPVAPGVEMPTTAPPSSSAPLRNGAHAAATRSSATVPLIPPTVNPTVSAPHRQPRPPSEQYSREDSGNLATLSPPKFHPGGESADEGGHGPAGVRGADRRSPPSPLNRIHYYQNPHASSHSNLSQMGSTAAARSGTAGQLGAASGTTAAADLDESRVAMLLSAASRGHVDRVLSLLHAGMSPSSCDYDRRTALHVACSDGALEVVKVLIEEGADINCRDRFGHTPLDEAVAYQHGAIAELLMYYQAEHGDLARLEAQLITAAASNDLNSARALLSSGVAATCFDYDRRTPLHLAVSEGHLEMAKLLMDYKADPMAEDRWGSSPLSEIRRRLTRTGQDPMRDVFSHLLEAGKDVPLSSRFGLFYAVWEVILICLMGGFARYDTDADGRSDPSAAAISAQRLDFATVYPLLQDVTVMIFVGFAYLMVFLRKHGYTSVGVTFLVAAFVIQWYQLTRGFWYDTFNGAYDQVMVSIQTLVQADFCAGAVLITFGVVLGKVSPSQMMLIALVETVFYSLNEQIGLTLQVADVGGTMTIHMFGAFFGIAVSLMVTPRSALGNQNNASVYHSDIMAMVGTIFLWMFWPSFNAALAFGNAQPRAVINTLLSLCASCVAAFLASYTLRRDRRFNMVDVQNATLAGGVAMGACCDMLILPGSAMGIGAIAGVVSVVGFVHVQPWLEEKIGLHDTCGVNNLHGMPSIVGGIASIIAASVAADTSYSAEDFSSVFGSDRAGGRSAGVQGLFQLVYMGTSIGIGLSAGFFTGLLARLSFFEPPGEDDSDAVFQDDRWWEVPHLELPYYFDRRGEISRGAGNLAQVNVGIADAPSDGAQLAAGEVPSKARYQRLLESKLDALRQELTVLKRQQRAQVQATQQQQSPALAYTRPSSPIPSSVDPKGPPPASLNSGSSARLPASAGFPGGYAPYPMPSPPQHAGGDAAVPVLRVPSAVLRPARTRHICTTGQLSANQQPQPGATTRCGVRWGRARRRWADGRSAAEPLAAAESLRPLCCCLIVVDVVVVLALTARRPGGGRVGSSSCCGPQRIVNLRRNRHDDALIL